MSDTTAAAPSRNTVMVANKLPFGLHLDLPKELGSKRVTIKGAALPANVMRETPLPGGFALSPVPEDHWNAWVKINKDLSIVQQGLVFSAPRRDHVTGKAVELAELVSGLEPINPNKLPNGIKKFDPNDDSA